MAPLLQATARTVRAIQKADRLPTYANRRGGGRIGGGASAPDSYSGYFTVISTETGVKVVNGADPDGAYAGYIQVGSQNIHCESKKVDGVSGAGSFYVRTFWNATTNLYDYEYKFALPIPSVEQEVNTELSSLAAPVSPATVGILTQRWKSGAINNINGAYVT